MNISQLIKLLSQYPSDAEVLVEGYESGYDSIHSLSVKTVSSVLNAEEYDGLFDTPDNLSLEPARGRLTGLKAMVKRGGDARLSCVVIEGQRGHRR